MSEKTNIEWTDSTWNSWLGCHKVSAACRHCYMERDMRRYGRDPNVVVRSRTTFDAPVRWKEPKRIFTCSWSDFFIEEADPWRDEAWDIIRRTTRHTYQILTKRPERIAEHLPPDWPFRHVWLGVTVENREAGLPRMDTLREIPATIRFISAEPLLADLEGINLDGFHWVIAGGESGPHGRRMMPGWPRQLRDQCVACGIPFFFKQWGRFNEAGNAVGKKKAGKGLDGREWCESPERNDK
ncbi:MAG: phage Gp37/Gp68 family protein [Planctomycetota bacterium]